MQFFESIVWLPVCVFIPVYLLVNITRGNNFNWLSIKLMFENLCPFSIIGIER